MGVGSTLFEGRVRDRSENNEVYIPLGFTLSGIEGSDEAGSIFPLCPIPINVSASEGRRKGWGWPPSR